MPRFQVTAPDGRTVVLEGDGAPTDADLEQIFKGLPAKEAPEERLGAASGLMAGQVAGKPIPGLAQTAAPMARYGGAILGSEGGPMGAALSGGGEKLAQLIEGKDDPRATAQATGMGALPLGLIAKVLKNPVLRGAAMSLLNGGANYGINKAADAAYGTDGTNEEKQAGIVAGATAASPIIGGIVGKLTGNVAPEELARIKTLIDNNQNKDQVLAAMKARGAAVVPSAVDPSFKNKLLESIAGMQNVEGGVARENQPIFNDIGREEASLAPGTAINEKTLAQARGVIGSQSYDAANKLGFGKELNNWRDASTNLKAAEAELKKGFTNARGQLVDDAQIKLAAAESDLNKAANSPDAVKVMQDAKQAFAKNYDVEQAVASGTDEVRPSVLSGLLEQRGDGGLTGGLRDIAQFNNGFSRSAKNPNKLATAPGAAGAGAALIAGGGNPVQTAALTGGVPMIREAVRDMLVSPAYQAKNAVRNYTPRTSSDPKTEAIIARIEAMLAANGSRK